MASDFLLRRATAVDMETMRSLVRPLAGQPSEHLASAQDAALSLAGAHWSAAGA